MALPAAIAIARPARSRPNRLQAFVEKNWRHIAELLFIVPAYTSYQFVRGAVHGKAGTAFDNASALIHVEQRIGIFHEAFLQQLILPKAWMVDFFNYLYIWGHLPVIIAVALWLYIGHLIPLVPFLVLSRSPGLVVSIVLSGFVLFGVGVYSATTLVGDWRTMGLKMVVIGLGAAALGFGVGLLFNSSGA